MGQPHFQQRCELRMTLEAILREAVMESIITCPECGNRLEPDAETCGECGWSNPLIAMGMI